MFGSADRLLSIEQQFPLLGGSHAQREVFEDTLIDTLIRAGRTKDASHRLQARLDRRPSALDQGWLVGELEALDPRDDRTGCGAKRQLVVDDQHTHQIGTRVRRLGDHACIQTLSRILHDAVHDGGSAVDRKQCCYTNRGSASIPCPRCLLRSSTSNVAARRTRADGNLHLVDATDATITLIGETIGCRQSLAGGEVLELTAMCPRVLD